MIAAEWGNGRYVDGVSPFTAVTGISLPLTSGISTSFAPVRYGAVVDEALGRVTGPGTRVLNTSISVTGPGHDCCIVNSSGDECVDGSFATGDYEIVTCDVRDPATEGGWDRENTRAFVDPNGVAHEITRVNDCIGATPGSQSDFIADPPSVMAAFRAEMDQAGRNFSRIVANHNRNVGELLLVTAAGNHSYSTVVGCDMRARALDEPDEQRRCVRTRVETAPPRAPPSSSSKR